MGRQPNDKACPAGGLGIIILLPGIGLAAPALLASERTEAGAIMLLLSVVPVVLGLNLIWEALTAPTDPR